MLEDRKKAPRNARIITDLRICGHFLHFKMGEKAGRRRIFGVLSYHGALPQRRLQEILGLSSGSLSEILAKMEADGLVEKRRSPVDGRQMELRLSEEGRREAHEAQRQHEARVAEILACLSEEEKEQMLVLLDKLVDSLDDIHFPCAACAPRQAAADDAEYEQQEVRS